MTTGGVTVTVDGGTYTTIGHGSPTIYSTTNIRVSNETLISKTSEGIVIEEKNSVTIENTTLTDSTTKQNAIRNIMVDSISSLNMNLSESYYEGTINAENSTKSLTLNLNQNSKIKLIGGLLCNKS